MQIVDNHKETMHKIYAENFSATHSRCEYANNCYEELNDIEREFLKEFIVLECFKKGKIITFDEIDISKIGILDLYNRKHSEKVAKIINEITQKTAEKKGEEKTIDPVMQIYNDKGCYARAIQYGAIKDERSVLQQNKKALREHGIETNDDFIAHLADQLGTEKRTPDTFKYRPCTYIKKGLPIPLFRSPNLALIIDPSIEKGTMTSFIFKENAESSRASTGSFPYFSKTGPLKDKADIIQEKIIEMNLRANGIIYDPFMHYFGRKLSHNEVLGTYTEKGIIGIAINSTPEAAREVILLRAQLGHPLLPIYHYSSQLGMVPVSDADLIKQSEILKEVATTKKLTDEDKKKAITERIQLINSTITNPKLDLFLTESILRGSPDTRNQIYTQTLSINLTGDKNLDVRLFNKLQEIKSIFCKVEEIDEEVEEKCIPEYSVTEKSGKISLTFTGESYCVNSIIKMALAEVEEIFDLLTEEERREKLLRDLKLEELEIKCISNPLIDNKPLQFEFIHSEYKEIKCIAKMKETIPIIEFHLPGGKVMEAESDQVLQIAKCYFNQQIKLLNNLLNSPNIQSYLQNVGIQNLELKLITTPRKNAVEIKFDLANDKNQKEAIERLVDLLKLKDSEKINKKMVKLDSGNLTTQFARTKSFILTAPDIMNVDSIIANVARVAQIKSAQEDHEPVRTHTSIDSIKEEATVENNKPTIDPTSHI